MTGAQQRLLRASLVAVWLATAVVSVWELHGQSRELLAGLPTAWAGGHAPWLPTAIILAGAGRVPARTDAQPDPPTLVQGLNPRIVLPPEGAAERELRDLWLELWGRR